MLYDFYKNTPYKIDIKQIDDQMRTLSAKYTNLKDYFMAWRDIFNTTYASGLAGIEEKLSHDEYYKFTFPLTNTTSNITFNITQLLKEITKKDFRIYKVHPIDLQNQLDGFECIENSYSQSKRPILTIPYFTGFQPSQILIDGNNRLSEAIQNGKSSIKVFHVTNLDLILANIMLDFEKAFYLYRLDNRQIIQQARLKEESADITQTLLYKYYFQGDFREILSHDQPRR